MNLHVAHSAAASAEFDDVAAEDLTQWETDSLVCDGLSFFQTFQWCQVAAHYKSEIGRTPFVACGHVEGTAFYLPLSVASEHGVKVARLLGEPFTDYGTTVGAAPTAEALRACLAALRARHGVDVVVLRRVPDATALAHALDSLGATISSPAASPYIPLGPAGPLPNAQGGQSFGYREGSRRRRRMQKAGVYAFQIHAGGAEAQDAVRLALAWKKAWVEDRGLLSRLRNDSLFAQTTVNFFGANGYDARIGVVIRDGEPVAVETGFVHRDQFLADLCSYRPDQRKDGAGKVAFTEMTEWAGRAGLTAYDKGQPADSYKLEWTDLTVPIADRTLALSLLGRLHGRVETQLKPMAKAALKRLPPALRSRLMRLAPGQSG